MANPNNALGTNGAFGGRTSPNAFNDVLALFKASGILNGWAISPSSGMTIAIGGDGENRDVAIAEDNTGNKTTIDNISGEPVELEISSAPASNSRIDAIVAYVNNPPEGTSTAIDNPGAVGLLDVVGTTASSPTAPTDSDIRSAITADGASGTTAYYVILGYVTVASGTTDITSNMITAGPMAGIVSDNIDWTTTAEDFTSKISLNETPLAIRAVKFGKMVVINYAGADVSHSIGQNILTIPEGYRPATQLWFQTQFASQTGNITVNSNGRVNCNAVPVTSAARVFTTIVYFIV